jgi:hypothetical protein
VSIWIGHLEQTMAREPIVSNGTRTYTSGRQFVVERIRIVHHEVEGADRSGPRTAFCLEEEQVGSAA